MATKFTYDTANKLFILSAGVTSLDLRTEFYAWVKKDWKDDPALTKFRFPVLAIGGQDIGGGQSIAAYYQLLNGWKIRPQETDHLLTVTGNLITDDGSDPFINTVGSHNVRIKFVVSANAVSVAADGGAGPSAAEIAAATRQEIDSNSTRLSLIAAVLRNKMVTDPATGKLTIYADDDATPLYEASVFEDAAGVQPYRGTGAERRDRLT